MRAEPRRNSRRWPPHQDDYAAPEAYPPQHYQQAETFQPRAQVPGQVPGYPPDDAGYEHEAEYQTNAQSCHVGAEDHDFYDDVPPRRRIGNPGNCRGFRACRHWHRRRLRLSRDFWLIRRVRPAAGDQGGDRADQDRARREF